MPIFSFIALFVTLLGQGLTFSPPHTWSFIGRVMETRRVHILGMPADVAKVKSEGFDAWVILSVDTRSYGDGKVVLGNARAGDRVRVSISGPHVLETGVDWSLCKPFSSGYCWLGRLYDDGLFGIDYGVPLSPSNEFIHSGHPNPSSEIALFWNTQVLERPACLLRKLWQSE